MRWVWYVARMEGWRGTYRILVEKPEGKKKFWRSKHECEDNNKKGVQEVGFGYQLDCSGSG